MDKYILAIDAGTTSSRAIIFDREGQSIGISQHEFTQYFPNESWVEHDAIEIWETQLLAIKEVLNFQQTFCRHDHLRAHKKPSDRRLMSVIQLLRLR